LKAARVPRVWIPNAIDVNKPTCSIELPKRTAHHLFTVLRLSDGDLVELFNGDGCNYSARLLRDGKKALARVESAHQNNTESPLETTLVQSISRGDRMDTSVQKCVELGVNHIQPVYTEHSVPVLKRDRSVKKQEHWQAIAISAAEQSGRSRVPEVAPPLPLSQWLQNSWDGLQTSGVNGWVLDPIAGKTLADAACFKASPVSAHHLVLIGPETGLSPSEIDAAVAAGFLAIRFGRRVLRTETAGPAVVTALQTLHGDLLA